MKFTVAIVLSLAAFINAAAIEPKVVSPAPLFTSAWNYQDLLTTLQEGINGYLIKLRTSISIVLRSSSNETLQQIQDNAFGILALEYPVREAIFAENATTCIVNLRVLLNAATEFTGFGSSNCAASYDQRVQAALKTAYEELKKLESNFGDVQQIVVKSFSGRNVFTEPDAVENTFKTKYTEQSVAWEAARGDVEGFAARLKSNIEGLNAQLGTCFSAIQTSVAPSYAAIQGEITTCNIFDNTADPFAAFRL